MSHISVSGDIIVESHYKLLNGICLTDIPKGAHVEESEVKLLELHRLRAWSEHNGDMAVLIRGRWFIGMRGS